VLSAGAGLVALGGCLPATGSEAGATPRDDHARPTPAVPAVTGAEANTETAGVRRLLPGPLGDGAAWEVLSDRPEVPFLTDHPEAALPPAAVDDFETHGPRESAPWFSSRELQGRLSAAKGDEAPLAEIVATHDGHALELATHDTLAVRVFSSTPQTPYVVKLRVHGDAHRAGEPRLLICDLSEDVSDVSDAGLLTKRILGDKLVTAQRVVGFGLKKRDGGDHNVYLEPEVGPKDAAGGFEEWRLDFETRWGAHSVAVIALGSAAGAVQIDDFSLQALPVRALLGLPAGAFTGATLPPFDLPRFWENLDRARPSAPITKVRLDWETRRALLLGRGASARCVVPAPLNGARVELGLGIVREERLLAGDPVREAVRVLATVRGGGRELARRFERFEVRLLPDAAQLWRDVSFDVPALPAGCAAAELELRVDVEGRDDPLGPLIALGDPLLVPRAPAGDERWNIVLVSLDTLRADRIGRKGPDGASITPNLDRLTSESVRFTHALANSSYTLPSHVSMFTSQRPGVHGVLFYDSPFSPERSPNFAQLLARRGWITAAFTSGGMLNSEFCGIDLGFDRFGEIDALLSPGDTLRKFAPLQDRPDYNRHLAESCRLDVHVLPWLADHRDAPFLLFLHTYLIHNYQPEPELAARFTRALPPTPLRLHGPVPYRSQIGAACLAERRGESRYGFDDRVAGEHEFVPARDLPWVEALYDATVAQADRDLGRLLDEIDRLGLRERTIVAVTADHGEEFLEHGDLSHARTLFDEILRVPLLLRIPGVAARTVDAPVELIELAPTLLARLGVPPDPRMQGRDLLADDWEEHVTIHEGVEAGAGGSPSERKSLRAARSRGAKLVLTTALGSGLDAVPQSEDALHQLRNLGYLVGAATLRGGFFDLRNDPTEQHDLSAGDSLDPRGQAQLLELLNQLKQAPAQPAAAK
jgi:arylsulfatase A-like enzyme